MKEVFRQIMSMVLAFLMLLSTMSFTVDMHFCGEDLIDFALFEDADTCGMEMAKSLDEHASMSMKMDCCSDIELVYEGQDDLKISFDQLSLEQQSFFVSFVYSYINLFEGFNENVVPFKDYSPPPLIRDVQILDQTFLI